MLYDAKVKYLDDHRGLPHVWSRAQNHILPTMTDKEYDDAVYASNVLNGKLFTEMWVLLHPKSGMVDR
jgi:hypothetical protein